MTNTLTPWLFRLWHHLAARRHRQLGALLALMVLASFAEVLSIGAVLPFLGVLTAPEKVFAHPLMQPVIDAVDLTNAQQILLPIVVLFATAVIFAGAIRLLLLYVSTRLSFAIGADLSGDIYRRTLYQPYAVHAARNSSELINGISKKTDAIIFGVIVPGLILVSSVLMLVAVLVVLLAVDPLVAIVTFTGFGSLYWGVTWLTRRQLSMNSERIAYESTQVIKSLQEGLGGIRDVLIDGSQEVYCDIYRRADHPLRLAQGKNQFIGASPRHAMETLGMVLIATIAYSLSQQAAGISAAIPVLGVLAIGAQRLLPTLQQAYSAYSSIKGNQASLRDILDLLDQPLPEYARNPLPIALPFMYNICLKNVCFRYASYDGWILQNLNLTIPKGSRVGFIGKTGSGKSTLLDIVMGLLQPTEGTLSVDGQLVIEQNNRAWQVHIAHVPQSIYLSDSSIEENIAFGVPKDNIDIERVRLAARQAQIAETIEGWPQQYQTFVGERGIRLSGGQRQRIGIARALYKRADVIIFDEATSALDNETERSVMEAIDGLGHDLTIFIIAHRLTTLQSCDQIIELGEGGVLRAGSYSDIVARTTIH